MTPSAGYVDVWASLVIGALVAVVCYFAVSKLKPRMGYDDALDAFGVHGVGGMVGTVLTGVFANPVLGGFAGLLYGDPMQVVRQLGSVLFVVVWAGGLTFVIAKAVERVGHGLRVSHDQEEVGLDMATHGEPSYPAYQGMDLH